MLRVFFADDEAGQGGQREVEEAKGRINLQFLPLGLQSSGRKMVASLPMGDQPTHRLVSVTQGSATAECGVVLGLGRVWG